MHQRRRRSMDDLRELYEARDKIVRRIQSLAKTVKTLDNILDIEPVEKTPKKSRNKTTKSKVERKARTIKKSKPKAASVKPVYKRRNPEPEWDVFKFEKTAKQILGLKKLPMTVSEIIGESPIFKNNDDTRKALNDILRKASWAAGERAKGVLGRPIVWRIK